MAYSKQIQENYKNYSLLISEEKELENKTIVLDERKKVDLNIKKK